MVKAILGFMALGVVFVAKNEASYAQNTALQTREETGTAYRWGSTIILDDGREISMIDPPEYPDGAKVAVTFLRLGCLLLQMI